MAIDYQSWKKKREEEAESGASPKSQFERWKAWKNSGDKSPSFASYEKKQKMLSGGLQPEDEAYNEWLDALNSYADRTSADYKSRENKYQSKSDLGRYNIDAAAHMAQLRTGAEQSRSYYEQNRDLYDEIYGAGTIDNILASLDSGTKHLDDISKGLKSEREYWGQWDDGATYKLALQAAEEQERRSQEQAAFISEDSDGYKSYGNNWARYVELSQKETLTKEEKAEAKAALKDMQSKYHVVDQSDVFATNMPKDMEKVYVNLQNKSNWGAGVTAGFMGAFGVDWLMDKGSDLLGNILGEEYANDESVQEQFDSIQAAHPGAHTTGSIAGNLASLLAAGKLVGAGTSAISGFSKLAPAVQKAATSGLTFGLTGGYRAATNTVSEPEWNEREQEIAKYYAQQGIRYDPVEYSAWGQVEDVLKQTGISTLGGVAGSFAGSLVGDLGKAFLVKRSLQTPFAETLRQTLSGTAFAAGNTAATYWLYPKESRPSKEKIAQDLAVAFLFSAITSTVNTMQTTKANKAFIDNAVAKMKQDYQNTLNTNMTAEEQIAALDDILAYNAQIRAAIKQNYYAGQQSYINEILQGMDAIDEQINIIKNGMASGNAPSGAANVPATVPQDAPTAPNPTVGNMPSVVSPVVPQGQAIDPNTYPAIIAQAMQLDPSTKANQIATAINNGELALSNETMIELETAITEAPNSSVDLRSAANEIAGIAEDDNGVPVVDTEKIRSTLADRGIEHGEIVDEEKFNNDPFTKAIDTLDGKKPNNTTMQDMSTSAPVATAQNAPATTLHNKSSILDSVKQNGAVNAPYDQVLRNVSDAVEAGAVSSAEVSDAYASGLAEYNKKDVVNNAPITADKESAAVVYTFDDDGKFIQESITDATNGINANAYAKEVEARLSSTNRYVDNGIVYRITGNDKDGYIAAVYRSDAEGNISNARSQLYTERGLSTRQDAVDALVGVSRSFAPKEGLQGTSATDTISLDEQGAVRRYKSGSTSYILNEKLNTGAELDEADQALMKGIDAALDKLPDYKGTTYRVLGFDRQGKAAYDAFLRQHEPGMPVIYDSYTSSSISPDAYDIDNSLKVRIEIDGQTGKDISKGFGLSSEQEVLFKRGLDVEVISVETDSDGNPYIKVKELTSNAGQTRNDGRSTSDTRERGEAVRDVQEHDTSHENVQGISGRNTNGNTARSDRPQQTVQGRQRDSVRPEVPESSRDSTLREEVKPHDKLSSVLEKLIRKGTDFGSGLLFEQADKAYGGTMAQGVYTVKDAYDALELAVNKTLLTLAKNFNGDTKTAIRAVATLQKLLDKIPTQTKRTAEQQSFQQFSTPPNIAYLAAWAANVNGNDVVLEPSAGIGGLAVFPKAWGAKEVVVNEYSERRLAFLKSMGFDRVFNENAEQLDNVLPDDVKPTLVIMNPPFSSTAGRTATNKTENATRHIEQALLRLEDGGRLVAILGRGMADDSATFGKWWDKLREKYNIRANISIDGSNYRKYGTTFDVQLVVIDKTGSQTGNTVTGTYKELTQIPIALEGIRNDRQRVESSIDTSRVTGSVEQRSHGNTSDRGNGRRPERSVERAGGSATANTSERALPSDSTKADGTVRRGGSNAAVSGVESSQGRDGTRNESGVLSANMHEQPESSGIDRPESALPLRELSASRKKASQNDNGIYAEYVPAELPIKGAKKHPAPLVESAAMAAVSAPAATYKPNLPAELIKNGKISSAQLENIVYAGQAHAQTLPDGTRKGYFIGDGTGVGKGRQISGIILDNMRQGRTKAIWVSKNMNLLPDAQRDWTDIGQSKDEVVSQSSFKVGKPIDIKHGIMFTGYDTLRSGKGNDTRLNQLIDWLGEDFDGVIAFDEAHNMGNLLGKKGARGQTKGSAKAQVGVELQKRLPNARVVYISATGATDVNELAYAQRLGLWGRGTAFNDVNDFVSIIGSSGIAAMELVARDMKAMGSYLARSISYDGVTYDTLQHDLTPMQTEIYDTMSEAWQITLQNINDALKITNGNLNSNAKGAARSAYYGAMQRFYNQVLTSMSMPSVIDDIKKELANGHSCVLQIVNTNAAEQERQLAKIKDEGGDLDDMDLTPRGTLLNYLENSFPVNVYEEYTDEDGKTRSRLVTDKNGKAVVDRQAVSLRDALISKIEQMAIPDGPLEMLFDAFGTDNVAEVTGRGRRVVPCVDSSGRTVRVEERRTKNHTEADIQAFQDGKKRILVFSDAGGTGKSYHADLRAKNQQKRVHYLVQPGWSASTATQGFGRTHRSNQAQPPQFKLVTTNIMGQKRFVSTIARRLDQLGALTKGQRETGSGMFTEKDNLESTLARDSLRLFYERLGKNRIEGVDGESIFKKLGLWEKFSDEYGRFSIADENLAREMGTFLNRILALGVEEQNTVFDEYYRIFESEYDKALENGTLDRGMENVKADRIEIVDDTVIRTDPTSGATTNYVQAKTYQKPTIIQTVAQAEDLRSGFQGFYRTDNGDVRAVYRVADKTGAGGKISKMYRMQSPVAGKYGTWSEETLNERATRINKAEWNSEWKAEVAKEPEYDERTIHMLTGTLLPIWNKLPQEGNTRAMRITADNGTQYLGRVVDANKIDSVLRQLGAGGRTKETFSAPDVMKRVLAGEKATLSNNRQMLVRRRVSNEYRIEVTGQNLWYLPRQYDGIFSENINYENRYFIPTGEKGIAILEALLKDNPVSEIRNTGEVDYLINTDTSKQAISSADTSINSGKLPAVFSKVKFVPGTVNLDIGGGKFDNATLFLKEQGVTSYIYDPYNRTPDHNNKSAAATQNGQSDTVTVSNVLNVIKEADARSEVLLNAVDAVKQNGIVYITIYEGDGKGVGRITKMKDGDASCWQEHRRTSSYIPEVKRYFKDVTVKNGVIIAKAPYKKTLTPKKQSKNTDYLVSTSDAAATWKVFRSVATPGADKWSATRVGDTSKAVMRISDIISKMRHDFGIPVEKGRMPRRDIAGKYDRHSHSIQTRIVNDLPTVAHELGHHLDNSYDITDGVSKELHNELVDQLDAAMKAEYPADKLRTEGFAEFIRRYMQNKETAANDYPLFTPYFREKVDPDVMSAVDGFADEINAYYSLDAETAQSSIRDYGEGPRDFRTVKEKTSDEADKLYQSWIDIFHGIKLFDRAAGTTTHMLAINSAYADSVAYSILTGDLTDINGKRVSSGLQQALNGINLKDKNEYKAFNEYLIVRHAPERLAEGMRIFPDDRKNSTAWMNARQTVLEQQHPEFEHAADRLYEFQKQFLQTWGVQTGLVDRDSAEQWAERWQYYVPFNRAIAKQSRIGAKRGFANQNSTIKRARGSGEDFYNPVDNIINNMVKMVNAAIRNNVMLAIRNTAIDAEGMALFLERVPAPTKRNVYNVSALKQSIVEQVTDASLTSDDTEKVFGIIDGMDDVLVQYERGKASGNVIAVLVDGKPEYWKINDPLLLKSLTNMSQKEVGAILHALGTVSRFMTANITGLNLIWSIGSNTVRDLGTLLTFSKDKNLVHVFSGIFRAYINSVRKPDNQDPMYKEFLAMGGGSESVYTADKNMTKDIKAKMSGDKTKWLNPLEWIEVLSNIIERGPRYATYKMMRDKGMTPQQAIYESHDITVNFRRGGTISRQINKAVPFFNAGVQGIDKLLRWITCEDVPQGERAKAVRTRVIQYFAAFGILGALQWFINSRDEEAEKYYAQLSTYTKNNFWCLPIYENGKATGEYVTIPKSRELAIPSSLVSALLEYGISRNDDAFHEFDEYALGSYLPNLADDLVKAGVDVAKGDFQGAGDNLYGALGSTGIVGLFAYTFANKDFLGRPIESAYYQNLEPRDRYNSRTSKAAYAIGQAFNMSPIKIDYFLGNFLGGFWKTQKALFPVDHSEADYSMGLASTYVRNSKYSTDLVNVMYDTKRAALLAKNSDPDDIGKAIAYKESNNMTTFYSRFNKLDSGDSSTRQIVLDMIYDFNKAVKGDYRTELQKKMDVLCEKVGNTEAMIIAVQPFVKDDDGTRHELTAAEYVEYQGLFNGLYWKYVAKALNTSTDYRKQYIAVMEARSMAVDEARATMLSRMSVGSEDYTNIIGANQVGLTSEDTMLFRAALEAADAQTDGNLKKDEFLDVLNAADFTDEQKAFLYSTEGNYSTQGNVWLTAGEINDWISEKRSTGKKDSEIASGITEVYKDLYLEYWAAGNQQGMNEITEKLMSLDLQNKDYMPYYSYDTFLKWIEDYMNP